MKCHLFTLNVSANVKFAVQCFDIFGKDKCPKCPLCFRAWHSLIGIAKSYRYKVEITEPGSLFCNL